MESVKSINALKDNLYNLIEENKTLSYKFHARPVLFSIFLSLQVDRTKTV